MDSADFLGKSTVLGIASLRVSIASATFPRRSAVGADCTGFLGSSTVPEIASLGISPVNLPGRSVVRGTTLAFWEAALSWGRGVMAWGVALVAWEASQVIFPSFLCN